MTLAAAFTAWMAQNGANGFVLPAQDDAHLFDAPPVVLWSATLPGVPAPTATRSEPAGVVVDGDELLVGISGGLADLVIPPSLRSAFTTPAPAGDKVAPGPKTAGWASALLVLDRHDGHLLQTLPMRAPVQSLARVDHDRLVVSDGAGYTNAYTRSGRFWTPAWTHYSGAPILSSPTVEDGVVYVANVDDTVYALDEATGDLRWRHQHKLDAARSAELELYGAPSPVVVGDLVFTGFSDGFLVALTKADGTPRWEAGVGEGAYPDLIAPPLLTDTGVLVGGFTEPVVKMDATSRTPAWRLEFGLAHAMVADGDVVFAPGTDGKLRRLSARTGAVDWTWDSGTGGVLGSVVRTPVGLFVPSSEGSLYLVDEAAGTTKWTFDPGVLVSGITAPPALAGRDLYVVTNGGTLFCLRAATPDTVLGTEDWVSPTWRD